MIKERTIYLSLYSKHVFDYRVKKAKEDLDSAITPIGTEFILVKVEQPKDFQS
jgi:hypothetical protein